MLAAAVAVIMLSSTAFAQQPSPFGNADEAKAMLAKAVAAVKADKTKALDMFNQGEGGFLDRDLYPFCFWSAMANTLPLRQSNWSVRILGPLKTPLARRLAWNSTARRSSRKRRARM
jgi:hypothetical protein